MDTLPVVAERHALSAPCSAAEIKARVQLIQQVQSSVMKKGTHYDKIPGTDKDTLLKPGAEVLCMTFRIAVEPEVHDLSAGDEVRYRVRALGRHQGSGEVVGIGIGECSSHEEKYKWRRAVCNEEFDDTAEDRRREKYQRGQNGHYKVKQIRTQSADVANTVLKMAKKRALVDFTLTALAASDMFAQDLEDMPEELRDAGGEKKAEPQQPRARKKDDKKPDPVQQPGAINPTQASIVRKTLERSGKSEADLCKAFSIEKLEELPAAKINEAIDAAKGAGAA